jgi:hypothetical protein
MVLGIAQGDDGKQDSLACFATAAIKRLMPVFSDVSVNACAASDR